MSKLADSAVKLSEKILERRWILVGLTALLVVVIEIEEHWPLNESLVSVNFWRETIIFGLVLPASYGILLSLLERLRSDRAVAVRDLDQQHMLSSQLSQANHIHEVYDTIVKFPGSIMPVAGASLRVLNPETSQYDLVNHWVRDGDLREKLRESLPQEACFSCAHAPASGMHSLTPCPQLSDPYNPRTFTSYCLPLKHRNDAIAILLLHFVSEPTILSQQVRVLFGAAPEMALALESARLKASAATQAEAAIAERRRIARDLHDTLGQNIGYLRLKLDQLSEEDVLGEISVIRDELERMRDIADDAYTQVRSTLAALHPSNAIDLSQLILEYIQSISGRTAFKITFTAQGDAQTMPAMLKRQVSYVFKEIMNNIEKHAQAQNVHVELIWRAHELVMTVSDDGKGFDTEMLPPEGHYGLRIMQERAEEINGQLQICSQRDQGTQVVLSLPLDKSNNGKSLIDNQNDGHSIQKVLSS